MKLLLTSAGLENKKVADFFLSILPKPPEKCSLLMVAYAQDNEEISWVEEGKKELSDLGFTNLHFFNLSEKKFDWQSENFEVIFVFGGGTFDILERMRITGIDKAIKDYVRNRGAVYFGISASSIIAGPDIEIAGWGSDPDENDIGLQDLTGLGLTDIAVFPHFKTQQKDEVEEFRKKVNYPVIGLTDNEAIFVDDTGYKIIR
jgi:dipeptidase E